MCSSPETIRFYRKHLPHWEVECGRYFVTIHLKGSIPEEGIERIKFQRRQVEIAIANGQDGLKERRAVFLEMERWLDCAPSVNFLAYDQVASMVTEAIIYREMKGIWTMYNYVIMPNHLHLFFQIGENVNFGSENLQAVTGTDFVRVEYSSIADDVAAGNQYAKGFSTLDNILSPFKHWTSREAKRLLNLPLGARFWQREWFDHWSRSAEEDEKIKSYIHANPAKAGLTAGGEVWPWLR